MDHGATFLEIDESDDGSIWPWVIALLAAVGVVLASAQISENIQDKIAHLVRQNINTQGFSGINIAVDGRDVSLTGTVDKSVDRRTMLAQVERIAGVNSVRQDFVIFDPEEAARQRIRAFATRLESVDFAAVAFEPSSASLTAESRPALESLAQLLLSYPDQRVRVSGHTDNTGRSAINLRISRERAEAVANYLIARGVTTSQVVARGFGASRPIADNNSDAGRARNRRIEINHIN